MDNEIKEGGFKKWWWIIGIVILILILSWVTAERKPAGVVRVGVIIPLTGNAAALGNSAQKGLEMAINDLGLKDKFKVIYEDDQFTAQKTVSAFNKLAEVDKADYIITLGSAPSNTIGPIAQEKRIVHIAISTDPKVLDYTFSMKNGSDPKELSDTMAKEVERRDYKKIALLANNHEGVLSIVREFKNNPVANRIAIEEIIDPNESDFRTVLAKVKQAKPDAILLELLPGKVGLAAKQARELGINIPLFGAITFEDQNAINASAGALEGQWYVNSQVSEDFISRFKEQYNFIPSREAGNAYDSIVLFNQSIDTVGNNPIKVNDYLHQLKTFDSKTILGGIKMDNGNFINSAIIKIIKKGQFVPYK